MFGMTRIHTIFVQTQKYLPKSLNFGITENYVPFSSVITSNYKDIKISKISTSIPSKKYRYHKISTMKYRSNIGNDPPKNIDTAKYRIGIAIPSCREFRSLSR